MDIQRVRNLITKRLHTKMSDIYEDIEYLTGMKGIMTHQLPNALRAMTPYLQAQVTDQRFWDGEYDPTHVGHLQLNPLAGDDLEKMKAAYIALPSPFNQPRK
jgi:hypothetical protein